MAWTLLFVAGLCEVVWAVGLKQTHGFTRPVASVITGAAMVLSFVLLGLAVRTLPIGIAYAVWTGIGTVGTALFAFTVLGETVSPMRIVFLAMIVAGIVGLKMVGTGASGALGASGPTGP